MMNNTRLLRRSRRAGPRAAQLGVAAIIGLAVVALPACSSLSSAGSGGSPEGGGTSTPSTSSQKVLAFSHCIRSHGVPNFPDPDSNGDLPKRVVAQLTAGNPRFPAAHRACEHLLPNGGQPSQAQTRQAWNDMRSFARCMRSHGVPDWPDPVPTSHQDQRPFFYVPDSIDPNAPQITTKIRACQYVLHANNPLVTTQ